MSGQSGRKEERVGKKEVEETDSLQEMGCTIKKEEIKMRETVEIDRSVTLLRDNLSNTARVSEWANLMGYSCPKRFARMFLRHYSARPQKIMESVRIKSITRQLREGQWSNFEIARAHGIADEIALNKFVNYHLGCSPTRIKHLSEIQLCKILQEMNGKMIVTEGRS